MQMHESLCTRDIGHICVQIYLSYDAKILRRARASAVAIFNLNSKDQTVVTN